MELYEEKFMRYLAQAKRIKETSRQAYWSDVKEFSVYLEALGRQKPEEMTTADVRTYLQHLQETGKTTSTVNRRLASLRSYGAFLAASGLAPENPAREVRLPKTELQPVEVLTIAEVDRLLEKPDDSVLGMRDRALLEVLYGAGLRAGEAIGLNLEDVNLRVGFLTCGATGKTRIIPLGKPAKAALETYIYHGRPSITSGQETARKQALFVNYNGQRLTRQGLWKILKSYGEGEDFADRLTPQILRNSFAVHMLQNGADLKTIQELLGTEDLTSIRTYLSTTKTHIKDVYDRTHPRA